MGDELVFALLELLDEIGIALGRQRVHRHAGPNLVAIEHVQDTEDAGPVAVLALRPDAVVGHEAAELAGMAWVPVAALVRDQLPIFEMQQHEGGDPCVAGPGELGPERER